MRSSGEDRNVARSELIGLRVEVVGTNHPPLAGLAGLVVDETRHTLMVAGDDGKLRRIPKPGQRFRFATAAGPIDIEGETIDHNPEDRIKKIR